MRRAVSNADQADDLGVTTKKLGIERSGDIHDGRRRVAKSLRYAAARISSNWAELFFPSSHEPYPMRLVAAYALRGNIHGARRSANDNSKKHQAVPRYKTHHVVSTKRIS